MKTNSTMTLEHVLNTLEIMVLLLVLFLAFAFQLIFKELPCSLCLLQRVGFYGILLGFLMNLRFGLRTSHYVIALLSAIFTSFVALRQVALHFIPGSGIYDIPLLGMHLYTWSFIIALVVIVLTVLMMSINRQHQYYARRKHMPWLGHVLFAAVVILLSMNVIAVLLECGWLQCPNHPTRLLF